MSRPRSWNKIQRDYNYVFRDLEKKPKIKKKRPRHLDMTDEEIMRDEIFSRFAKATLTRMKKEAAQERLRKKVAAIMAEEFTQESSAT